MVYWAGKAVEAVRIRSNPHTHTTFSDGRDAPRAQIERALALGFRALGFSDHAVQDVDTFTGIPKEREADYQSEVRALAKEYAGRIRVYLGVELDSEFGLADARSYDYILLSNHYVRKGDAHALVDCRPRRDRVFAVRDEAYGGNGEAMAADYFLHLGARVLEERPAILGHFDIVKYFNGEGALYDADSPAVRRAQMEALSMVRESGALLEVNTGGMARGYVSEPYPSWDILRAWRDLGGGVILGSDCHDARLMDFAFADVLARLRAEGFGGVWELGGAGEEMFVYRRFSDGKV